MARSLSQILPIRVMVANNKGGCGKTTLAHHLAAYSAEIKGRRVLAFDTDRQGDLYRRLVGPDANLMDMPPVEWHSGCHVVASPEEYALPGDVTNSYDLVIVDTPPGRDLPRGPLPQMVVIPVDGVDAARNATETLASVREGGGSTVLVLFVLNGVGEGGIRHQRYLDTIRDHDLPYVYVYPEHISRGGAIKRAEQLCRPAWADPWGGRAAREIREACKWLDYWATEKFPHAIRAAQARAERRRSRG